MINLKSADRIKIRTRLGNREVKAELYKGFGINKEYWNGKTWMLTVIIGSKKGWGICQCRKKNDCRLLADEIINKVGKSNIEDTDIPNLRDIVKKYMVKEQEE